MNNAVKLESRGALATLAAAIIVEVVLSSGSYLGYRVWEVMDNNTVQNGWVSESRIFSAPVWAYKRSGKWTYGWSNISNEWYYFNSHGWMYSSRYNPAFTIIGGSASGKTFQFSESGAIVKNEGWKRAGTNGEEWVYWMPYPSYGAVRNGWFVINNLWYNFKYSGYVWKNEGWKKKNNKWMYFIPGNYGAYRNVTKTINGSTYKFDANGYCIAGNGC